MTVIAIIMSGNFIACSNDNDTNTEQGIILIDNSQEILTLSPTAGSQEIKFISNADWQIKKYDDSDTWFNITPTNGNAGENIITIEVSSNDSYEERGGQFSIETATYTEAIPFVQAGKDDTMYTQHVETAGTLYDLFGTYEVRKLKLSGYINGTDIATMRKMPLIELDLSDAHIVGGGSYEIRFYNGMGTTNKKVFSTTDNIFPDYFYYEISSLQSIILPKSVTEIGHCAFKGCTGLTSVEIPNSVTEIGSSAFEGCTRLTFVKIPNSVTKISDTAFSGCRELTSVEIPNSITEISNSAFSGCAGLTSVEIPNSITEIGYYAFGRCTGLTFVKIPNSVTEIGSSAFSGCTGLTSVEIPNSITEIGSSAFEGCTGLTSITIPSKVTSLVTQGSLYPYSSVFADCTALKEVHVKNPTPPEILNDTFSTYAYVTLYVPAGSKEAYQNHSIWKKFGTIIEEGEASIPIVGTWKAKTPNGGGYTEYFIFNSDKTGKSWEVSSNGIQGKEETFTYKIEDDKLIFSWKGGGTYTSIFILSDNNLTIKDNATSTIFIRI